MPSLEQIQEKMKKLQAQADTLIAKKAQAAVDQIRKIMLTYGLTTVDIEVKAKAKREAKAANRSIPNVKAKAAKSLKNGTPPKYQHPKTGATWTGHGRAPAWIADAKDRTKFLIASGTDAVRAASVSLANPVSKAKAAVKKASVAAGGLAPNGQRKGPQPTKYLDPKSGATWSGRGPAPAWLAAAKDRTRFLVDGADSGSADAGSAKLAGKKSSDKQVAKKKAVATTPAAKKAVTAKTVSKKIVVSATQKAPAKKAPTKKTPPKSAAVSSPPVVLETGVSSTT
jgi:DNA-binding protein H-NS